MRNLRYLVTALALAGGVTVGCSSSSSVGTGGDSGPDGMSTTHPDSGHKGDSGHKTDSGHKGDSSMPGMDGSKTDSPISMMDSGTDGPCNFATFVIGLINNDTTATALPSADLGQACTDNQNQAEFAVLF